ncbi:hypothetical protein [Sneathiella glossodoripedis]|uniref:hypothetical protein n=1 Tax=Sneathiella glossodoripedis TaxID=418853 RepID=UPI00046F610A|nr:hypothetical protein [Sneathiella glossodoripedis]
MIKGIEWMRLAIAAVVIILLGLLAFSETPNERRAKAINEALAKVDVAPARLQSLREQTEWILRNTDLSEEPYVEQKISLDRLDIVVTDDSFSNITKTGRANAIYDPGLKVIFIDQFLLRPTDLTYLGTDGPAAASSESEFGFWNTSLSFVIAHELGHHAATDAASAFFSVDWLGRSPSEVDAEIAADAYALATLSRAYADPAMPEALVNENALFFFGLDLSDLSGAERAAGDIIGALKGMTLMMQFSSGPYSPFYQDKAHPSFLERIRMAIEGLSIGSESIVHGQSPILVEETRRQQLAANRRFVEIQAPGPIARVVVGSDNIFVAVRSLIQNRGDEGLGAIHRLHLHDGEEEMRFELVDTENIAPAEDEDPNAWIEGRLGQLAPGSGTEGFVTEPGTAKTIRLFEALENTASDELMFFGEGWAFPGGDQRLVVSTETAQATIRSYLGVDRVELGPPFASASEMIFPTYFPDDKLFRTVSVIPSPEGTTAKSLFVFEQDGTVAVSEPSILVGEATTPFAALFSPKDGWIDVEGARWAGTDWMVPGRASSEDEPYVWKLYRGRGVGGWVTQSRERLLADYIAETGEASFGRDLDPQGASLLVLDEHVVLVWYDNDTVWLSTPDRTVPIFHPASSFLRVTRIDKSRVLFWISNATKAYLVSIDN